MAKINNEFLNELKELFTISNYDCKIYEILENKLFIPGTFVKILDIHLGIRKENPESKYGVIISNNHLYDFMHEILFFKQYKIFHYPQRDVKQIEESELEIVKKEYEEYKNKINEWKKVFKQRSSK